MKLALAALALAACSDPPPLTIAFTLASTDQVCVGSGGGSAQSCSDVALPCMPYLSVRIVSPSDPTHEYASICTQVTGHNLCSIAGVALPSTEMPAETLEVQVAVYPAGDIAPAGNAPPVCPPDPAFAPDGLPVDGVPIDGAPIPAIGGMAYYHAGDTKTIVPLGCTSQRDLNACIGVDTVAVTSTVVDFGTDLGASDALADELDLFVGEPKVPPNGMKGVFALEPGDTTPLDRTSSAVPSWIADVSQTFETFDQFACIEVLDNSSSQITPVLTCQPASPASTMLDFTALRISPATLSQVLLAATGASGVPENGITIGVVLDFTGQPYPGATVTASDGMPVQYLSADGTTLVSGTTTGNGIFVAPTSDFGTTFFIDSATKAIGGTVQGKVTAAILQFKMPTGN